MLTGTITGIVAGAAGHTGIVNDNIANPGIVEVRNVTIAGTSILAAAVPSGQDDCKKGRWADLTRENGSTFRNQGDCIQYQKTGKCRADLIEVPERDARRFGCNAFMVEPPC